MFINQEGCCAICKRHQLNFQKRLFVDHDHKTNEIRALLCQNCNSVLGNAKDDITILQSSIKYLENYGK